MEDRKVYPAHYRKVDDMIQTVEDHLRGVSDLCEFYAQPLGFGNTGKLMGVLHDMGKYTDEFYGYMMEAIQREKNEKPKLSSNIDHGRHGARLLLKRYHNGEAFRNTMAEIMAMIICYHHGGLEDYISEDLESKLLKRCCWPDESEQKEDAYDQACQRLVARVISFEYMDELFKSSVQELETFTKAKRGGDFTHFELQLLIKYLYSCLIDADRYDTYLFMQNEKAEEEIAAEQLWNIFDDRLQRKEETFRNLKTDSDLEERIKNLRYKIWQQCNEAGYRPEGIFTLTVPTGGGKTLSSLRYSINHAKTANKKQIIYVLPYTAIIEQNAQVVRDALDTGEYLLEYHSNVIHEEEILDIPENQKDNWEYRNLLTEQWSVPIIFTTMVQFLNTLFAGGTQSIRRFHNLTDTILIFDEIQALPVKCISLFNEAINFLYHQCRDTILLCSATQPSLDQVKHEIHVKQEIISDLSTHFQEFKRMEIKDERYRNKMSVPELGGFIQRLKLQNESILVVLNTKKCAEDVYKEVKAQQGMEDNDINYYFLSTNLCSSHRKKVIKEMKQALLAHKPVICVSTQLIEAGVDISFHCVVRHLAGMDSIAQASGRGNRNGEGTIKNTYVIQLEDERLGSLKELELGEQCAIGVLDDYKHHPERFDHDLLSPKTIMRYYQYFYQEGDIEKQMDYPISGRKTSIFHMLSNQNRKSAYRNAHNKDCPLLLEYQFRTAADNFEVIEEESTAVLVPYGEGIAIISQLCSMGNKYLDLKLIRKTQPYMVNISKSQYRELKEKNAVRMDDNSGVLILDKRFYDLEIGVKMEGGRMDTLFLGSVEGNM